MSTRQWYRFATAADNPSAAELIIFGNIGRSYWDDDAVTAKQVMDDLKALPSSVATLTVRVNSLGGDAFAGLAIANALREWSRARDGRAVTTVVEGIAASAASVVLMAGGTVRIADNALIMIHCASTFASGNAGELRKMAEALAKVDESLVATYKWHSSLEKADIQALLEAETWMTADEAIANGFATEKVEGLQATACLDPRAAEGLKIPPQFKARVDALLEKPAQSAEEKPAAATAEEVLRACEEADCLALAKGFIAQGATLANVQAGIATATEQRQQSAARAQAIRAACEAAKVPATLAESYIASAMPLDAVKAQLAIITALIDKAEIDGGLDPDAGQAATGASWKKAFARALPRARKHSQQ